MSEAAVTQYQGLGSLIELAKRIDLSKIQEVMSHIWAALDKSKPTVDRVESGLAALGEIAKLTPTQVDDDLVEKIMEIKDRKVVEAIADVIDKLEGNNGRFYGAEMPATVKSAGISPMLIIQIAILIYKLFFK